MSIIELNPPIYGRQKKSLARLHSSSLKTRTHAHHINTHTHTYTHARVIYERFVYFSDGRFSPAMKSSAVTASGLFPVMKQSSSNGFLISLNSVGTRRLTSFAIMEGSAGGGPPPVFPVCDLKDDHSDFACSFIRRHWSLSSLSSRFSPYLITIQQIKPLFI